MYINIAEGIVLPPYWLNHPEATHVLRGDEEGYTQDELKGNLYQCPLSIKWQNETNWWRLPLDPVISVSGGNNIVRTDVLKQDNSGNLRRGSIKEVWSQNDYEIQIAGVFMSSDEDSMPISDMDKIRKYFEGRKIVEVQNDLLEIFGIYRIAIESYDFSHTNGRMNQQWSIKAYSDDDFSLLV